MLVTGVSPFGERLWGWLMVVSPLKTIRFIRGIRDSSEPLRLRPLKAQFQNHTMAVYGMVSYCL